VSSGHSAGGGGSSYIDIGMTAGSTAGGVRAGDGMVVITYAPTSIPTLSEWAMILFGLLLLGGGTVMIQRRRLI